MSKSRKEAVSAPICVTGKSSIWNSNLRMVLRLGNLRHDGCEIATGGVSADRNVGRIDAEFGGVLLDPDERAVSVIDRAGEFGFRRQAVFHRRDAEAARVGEHAAQPVVGGDVADHPATAVKIDTSTGNGSLPRGDRANRPGAAHRRPAPWRRRPVDLADRDILRAGHIHQGVERRARFDRREAHTSSAPAQTPSGREMLSPAWIERHGQSLRCSKRDSARAG